MWESKLFTVIGQYNSSVSKVSFCSWSWFLFNKIESSFQKLFKTEQADIIMKPTLCGREILFSRVSNRF